jgi:hypothetical protein
MTFLHKREYLNRGDVVEVNCSHQCNVMLTDDANFHKYKSLGGNFRYYGGFCNRLPARIMVPSSGYWNITLDLNGGSANIRHSMRGAANFCQK